MGVNMKDNKKIIKAVLAYIGHYKILLFVSLVMAMITVVLTLYLPILFGDAIDLIVGSGQTKFDKIFEIIITAVIVAGTTSLFQWLMTTINNKIAYNVVRDIRNDAFKRIERLPLSYLDSHSTGDIVSRVIADADQFSDGLLLGFTQSFTGIATILGTLVFMLRIDIFTALIVMVLTPLSLLVARFISKHTYSFFKLQSETRAEQTSLINEMIGGMEVVKAYGREEKVVEAFDEINEKIEKASLKAIFFSSITNPATRFVNNIVYALVGLVGAFQVVNGGISVGGLSAFLAYANQYTKPFNEISGIITELQNAIACAGRLLELINEDIEAEDGKTVLGADKSNEIDKKITNNIGDIDLENVSFSYVKDKKLIEGLNLSVKKGHRIAIVGPTGCGKTTIINLLMRFYDVDSGSIKVENTDIRELTRHSLRKSYGMVLQETWLRNGTIRENIVLGKPDATDEEVITAAKAAHSHSFISKLKGGYNTVIDEDGSGLSKGQMQLLCITRVMLLLPPMLILDEATSSIDTRTEIKIQKAFNRLMEGRTSFIVAHRLSTIKEADIILVMKAGKIIEQGNHEELLEKKGFYSELYNSQFVGVGS
ncbi:ABC transporter, ATP-binding protein [Catonella morbi ATCC 51271]|uniref:ABC transporter, ATP-binding protein n=2 Tax=Catonella TaxID=43996 RepID=V2XYQ6_9FIRM|nr:ABC transporter, ATP-binding protein [Catonella morbi ATCC 51271]